LLGIHYFSPPPDIEKRLIKTARYGTNFVLSEEIEKAPTRGLGAGMGGELLHIIPELYFPAPARLSSLRLGSRNGKAIAVAHFTEGHVAS
jgi:hypothetical protein